MRTFLLCLLALGCVARSHRRGGEHGRHGTHGNPQLWKCVHDVFDFVGTACPVLADDAAKSQPDYAQECLESHVDLFTLQCQTVVDHVIEGLDMCSNDTAKLCSGMWGMNQRYETPMACLRDQRPQLSQECMASPFMHTCDRHADYRSWGHWYGRADDMNERRRCPGAFMLWIVCTVVFLIGTVWFAHERRRRNALRMQRWVATGSTPQRTAQWTTGLFGNWTSFLPDWWTCLPSFIPCFRPFQVALNAAEMRDRDAHGCDVCFTLHRSAGLANEFRTRQEIRAAYDFEEAQCSDCLAVTCCAPCAVAQNARELDARKGVAQGHTPVLGNVAPQPMEMVGVSEPLGVPLKEAA